MTASQIVAGDDVKDAAAKEGGTDRYVDQVKHGMAPGVRRTRARAVAALRCAQLVHATIWIPSCVASPEI
jgi:hypothetical protein